MRATLTRTLKNEVETLGQLDVADFKCYTLERPDNGNQKKTGCIPCGIYPVTRHTSKKLGKTFWVHNVPNRDAILIHKGCFFYNSLGCILVGMEQKDTNKDGQLDNVSSTIAMNKLLEYDITEIEIIEI